MEAQACGTVFMTTQDFALKETVGYCGTLLGKDYDKQFIKRVKGIITEDSKRNSREQLGLSHVKQYTWANVAKTFIKDAESHFKARSKDVDGVIDRLIYESDLVHSTV